MTPQLTSSVDTARLAAEVEGLVDRAEPEGVYRDTREMRTGFLLLGLLLSSPPTPRPKKDVR
ncbi:hypothetical protein [Streptomyces sp. HPF1205]|uniref:hypothetical protein n=1 Tax=Streptomyces sp. HPF1205 TaxID=2873262 RepID=UPI001CEC98BB|nr:hypothetical protein [Streptomyces sp. HPF1205]